MDERTRKKMILEAKKYGGISIPHLKLQVHQNGAKFPISKVYIDDEQLDQDTRYTIIIIPEEPMMMCVVLTYFHRLTGPIVFHITPASKITAQLQEACATWMDAKIEPGFFKTDASVAGLPALNNLFEMKSEWARGQKEMVMISLVTDTKQNAFIEDAVETIFTEFVDKMKKEPGLFKGFYKETEPGLKPEDVQAIDAARKKMVELVEAVYDAILHAFKPQD